jgi:hypothetical protein
VIERIAAVRFANAASKINVEKILPSFTPQRARFDLGQVNIAQGEDSQAFEQGPWHVVHRKDDRGLGRTVSPKWATTAASL